MTDVPLHHLCSCVLGETPFFTAALEQAGQHGRYLEGQGNAEVRATESRGESRTKLRRASVVRSAAVSGWRAGSQAQTV